VIGPKKLSSIRQELERAISSTGANPIGGLEERISAREGQGSVVPAESEVLHSLRRVLEASREMKPRKQRVGERK